MGGQPAAGPYFPMGVPHSAPHAGVAFGAHAGMGTAGSGGPPSFRGSSSSSGRLSRFAPSSNASSSSMSVEAH